MTSELRPALEVWDLLWDAFTGTPPQSGNPNAPFEAAAAVIQAYGDEREAKGREEQAAELAKFKALAETLAKAGEDLKADMIRRAEWAAARRKDDDIVVEAGAGVWFRFNEALRQYKEARDD